MDINQARDIMSATNGLFTGQLSSEELAAFELLKANGEASEAYSGASGFLGLAKVRLKHSSPEPSK